MIRQVFRRVSELIHVVIEHVGFFFLPLSQVGIFIESFFAYDCDVYMDHGNVFTNKSRICIHGVGVSSPSWIELHSSRYLESNKTWSCF